jgi:hypothetical protein
MMELTDHANQLALLGPLITETTWQPMLNSSNLLAPLSSCLSLLANLSSLLTTKLFTLRLLPLTCQSSAEIAMPLAQLAMDNSTPIASNAIRTSSCERIQMELISDVSPPAPLDSGKIPFLLDNARLVSLLALLAQTVQLVLPALMAPS